MDKNISIDSAKLMSKVLVWLTKTQYGDRSEIGLISSKYSDYWSSISAKDEKDCIGDLDYDYSSMSTSKLGIYN